MKYKYWLDEWLTYHVKPTTKERTYAKYRRQIENHIAPKLGEYGPDELSAQALQRFSVELTGEGLASNTVISIVSVLKSSIKRAVALGVTDVQCTDAIICPKAKEKKIESFNKSEQRIIERYIADSGDDKLFGILLGLYTGLRHTFATRALEVGMDVKTLSEILGHKNPMVTLKRYAHSMIEYKTEMMNRPGSGLYLK